MIETQNSNFLIHPFKLGVSSKNVGHIINSCTLRPICNSKISNISVGYNNLNFRICKKCIKLHSQICKNERAAIKYDV